MQHASTPDPGRAKFKVNLPAKRMLAGLTRDLRQPFGCVQVPEQGRPAGTSA